MTKRFFLFLSLILLPALSFAGTRAIYGSDDRVDFYQTSADRQALADSVVSFWHNEQVENKGDMSELSVSIFGRAYNLCEGQRYDKQYMGAFCSGSLVGEDLVLTAAHCVKTEEACQDTKLVFGFKVSEEGQPGIYDIPSADVYSCSKIEAKFYHKTDTATGQQGQNAGSDYAVIRLDRKVKNHKPLPVNYGNQMKNGEEIFVIGYPAGIPLKVADGAKIRSNDISSYYSTDLDTFGGNSGSPVFNAKNNLIEGILVRGGTDFVRTTEGCRVYSVTDQDAGRGEDVTKISEAVPSLLKLLGSKEAGNATVSAVSVPAAKPVVPVISEGAEIENNAKYGSILKKAKNISIDKY